MRRIESIIGGKAEDVLAIGPEDSVYDALEKMAQHDIGALVVMKGDELVGIVSERDCARRVALADKDLRNTPVREAMTSKVLCVRADQSVEEAMAIMIDKHIRHIPVTEGRRVVGVISMRDAVREVVGEQRFMIKELEHYITRRVY